jgi:hypothetical protein
VSNSIADLCFHREELVVLVEDRGQRLDEPLPVLDIVLLGRVLARKAEAVLLEAALRDGGQLRRRVELDLGKPVSLLLNLLKAGEIEGGPLELEAIAFRLSRYQSDPLEDTGKRGPRPVVY